MERSRVRRAGSRSQWANLPPALLSTIFNQLPNWMTVSQVCVCWRRVILALPRPVVLCPVTDFPPPDPLPFSSIAMQLLVPTVATPRGVGVSRSINEVNGPFFRYFTIHIPSIGPEMRFIGGSGGLPLFVDDSSGCLVIRRLTSPQRPGPADNERAMALQLPDGVDSEKVYIGGLAVSSCNTEVPSPRLGISAIVVATRSCLLGIRTARRHQAWTVLHVTEPAEGRSFERQGLRTFVSILFDTSESAYLLDASRRLCFLNWNTAGRLQMQELPIQGGPNALLDDGPEVLKMVWLLQLPLSDRSGTNLVCLGYRWFSRFEFGRFVAFDLEEEAARRLWVMRQNILGDICVLVSWGPGAMAVVYTRPEVIGLTRGRIYSSQDGLRSYILGWNYSDALAIPSYWPFSLWIDPDFPNPMSLEDILVKVTVDDADGDVEDAGLHDCADADGDVEDAGLHDCADADGDAEDAGLHDCEDADGDAEGPAADMAGKLELSVSAYVIARVSAQNGAANTAPATAPTPLLDRLLRNTFLQLDSGFD